MKISTESRTMIVPWDFSQMSLDALHEAVSMIDDTTRIEVVHVTTPLSAIEYGTIWNALHEKTIVARLTQEFMSQINEMPDLKSVGFTVLFGDPGTRICEFAEEAEAATILMPSHGRTGVSRMFLGSVAERVVRYASCPVIVLRLPERESQAESTSDANVMASVIF